MSDGRERPRPVIGISAYREEAQWGVWSQSAVLVPATYVDKVTAAGGIALVIPPSSLTQGSVGQILDRLDGLVMAGGADLNPELYGEEPHEETTGWRNDRDDAEMSLVDSALSRDLPVLGICRGLQLMTVHAGGRLEQHLPDVVGHERHRPTLGVFGEHEVTLVDGSLAAETLGSSVRVKSYHHQGVADAGTMSVVGNADDGTIEAVQDTRRRFALGVLWHPEAGDDPRLFDALIAAASGTPLG
jgi:putative glutamine amidotransferase